MKSAIGADTTIKGINANRNLSFRVHNYIKVVHYCVLVGVDCVSSFRFLYIKDACVKGSIARMSQVGMSL